MQKKEVKAEESKLSHRHNWTLILVVLIIFIVILVIFTNGFSSSTGSAVRGGSKKADLVAGTDMDYLNYWEGGFGHNTSATIQTSTNVRNIGTGRAGKSILVHGIKGVTIDYAVSRTFNVDPLMPNIGDVFSNIFTKIPIGELPADGTPIEQEYILYSIADSNFNIGESNESNNVIERHFIFRCGNFTGYICCVKPLGEWPTQFTPTIEVECPT